MFLPISKAGPVGPAFFFVDFLSPLLQEGREWIYKLKIPLRPPFPKGERECLSGLAGATETSEQNLLHAPPLKKGAGVDLQVENPPASPFSKGGTGV
ncbi:MAG: hypothetical protein ACRESU_02925, partial [Gammaproteobacteria bacterium]